MGKLSEGAPFVSLSQKLQPAVGSDDRCVILNHGTEYYRHICEGLHRCSHAITFYLWKGGVAFQEV